MPLVSEPQNWPAMARERDLSACAQAADGAAIVITCHAWFHEQIGGSFKVATELAEYLAGQGHRVCYVCGTNERRPENPTYDRGVELWRYPYPRASSPHPANVWGHVLGSYRLTRSIFRRHAVEVINGHTPLQFLGASLAGTRRCPRHVYTVPSPFAAEVDCGWESGRRSLRHRAAVAAASLLDRLNCRRASVINCHSQFTAGELRSSFGDRVAAKTVITPGWVHVDRFQPVEQKPAARGELGEAWQTDDPIFFTVRRLEQRMGLDQLIAAAGLLRQEGLKFRVLIGGAGPLHERLQWAIGEGGLADTVYLLGRISDEQLPLSFAAADCFVLPTRALECFGLIVLEAFASGIPVIGTPVGAIPELVDLQGPGWLTAGTEARDIADRMRAFLRGELAGDPAVLRSLGESYRSERGLQELSEVLLPCPTR